MKNYQFLRMKKSIKREKINSIEALIGEKDVNEKLETVESDKNFEQSIF